MSRALQHDPLIWTCATPLTVFKHSCEAKTVQPAVTYNPSCSPVLCATNCCALFILFIYFISSVRQPFLFCWEICASFVSSLTAYIFCKKARREDEECCSASLRKCQFTGQESCAVWLRVNTVEDAVERSDPFHVFQGRPPESTSDLLTVRTYCSTRGMHNT